jgi:hypothetical protein
LITSKFYRGTRLHVPTTQEERQNVVIIEVVVNHGEDHNEEDVDVVFIGAKNP